jgi:hypothetical protein
MTAMFPDSGVPWTDARNSLPDPDTQNCNDLWYSTSRCEPRFDPAAANAMLSELVNLINKGEVDYDCRYLDQVERAVRYLIQRGLPNAVFMQGGPDDYTSTLDPPLTRHNDYQHIVAVPVIDNTGPVRLDLGYGFIPVLHCDGTPFAKGDLLKLKPVVLLFFQNNWYYVGLAPSQISGGLTNGSKRFNTPGVFSFIAPAATLFVQAWGGGGSGAATAGAQDPTGGGGGGGGYVEGWVSTIVGTNHIVTVGAGGPTIPPNSGSPGYSGTASIFNIPGGVGMTAGGGGGGSITAATPGTGGIAVGGQFTMGGGPGEDWGSQRRVCNGGQGGFGGGAGGLHGGSPGGQQPGGGGGGGNSSGYGGAGGHGSVVVRW